MKRKLVRKPASKPAAPPEEDTEIDPADPKGSASRRFISQDGATCGELDIVELEVTWGGEKFSPVQFHTVDVGPIVMRVRCDPKERVDLLFNRVYAQLERYGRQMHESKLRDYLERIKTTVIRTDAATVED